MNWPLTYSVLMKSNSGNALWGGSKVVFLVMLRVSELVTLQAWRAASLVTAQLQSHKHLSPACKSVSPTVSQNTHTYQSKINTVQHIRDHLLSRWRRETCSCCIFCFAVVKCVYLLSGSQNGKSHRVTVRCSLFHTWRQVTNNYWVSWWTATFQIKLKS